MATSGVLYTNYYNGNARRLKLVWSATQDIVKNESEVTVKLYGSDGDTSVWYITYNPYIDVDGTRIFGYYGTEWSNDGGKLRAGTLVGSKTFKVKHAEDGKGSFRIAFGAGIYTSAVNVTHSSTVTLDAIPRGSVLKLDNSGFLGTQITVSATRYVSSYTHDLKLKCGTVFRNLEFGSSAVRWNVDTELGWLEQFTTQANVPVELTLSTYSGSTKIGVDSVLTVWLTAPDDVAAPSITEATVESSLPVEGATVAGRTSKTISVTVRPKLDATITKVTLYAGNSTYPMRYTNGKWTVTATGMTSQTNTITYYVTAVDSRGYAVSTSHITEPYYVYSNPVIELIEPSRVRLTEDSPGSAKVKVNYTHIPGLNEGIKVDWVVSNTSDSEVGNQTYSDTAWSGVSGTAEVTQPLVNVSYLNTYVVTAVVRDQLGGTDTASATLPLEKYTTWTGKATFKVYDYLMVSRDAAIGGIRLPTEIVNEHGTARLFPSGYMECEGFIVYEGAVTTTWGSWYVATTPQAEFPVPFIEPPQVQLTPVGGNRSFTICAIDPDGGRVVAPTATKTQQVAIARPTASDYSTFRIAYRATGRWKPEENE